MMTAVGGLWHLPLPSSSFRFVRKTKKRKSTQRINNFTRSRCCFLLVCDCGSWCRLSRLCELTPPSPFMADNTTTTTTTHVPSFSFLFHHNDKLTIAVTHTYRKGASSFSFSLSTDITSGDWLRHLGNRWVNYIRVVVVCCIAASLHVFHVTFSCGSSYLSKLGFRLWLDRLLLLRNCFRGKNNSSSDTVSIHTHGLTVHGSSIPFQ